MRQEDLLREHEFLINCLRLDLDGQADKTIGLLREDLDWGYLVAMAFRHRVAPLLYYNLTEQGMTDMLPGVARSRLRAGFVRTSFDNQLLLRALRPILDPLIDADVSVVVLKGLALAKTAYPDIGLRPMRDMDLLVGREDQRAISEVLKGLGYVQSGRSLNTCEYRNSNGVLVDVHWDVVDLRESFLKIDIEEIWQRCHKVDFDGADALVLSPEDLILHLCTHLSYGHYFFDIGLSHFCDIHYALWEHGRSIDWDTIAANARRYGIGRFLYAALSLAKKALPVDVPVEVLDLLRSECSRSQLEWLEGKNVAEIIGFQLQSLHTPAARVFWIDGIRNKIRFLRTALFPGRQKIAMRYSLDPSSRSVYCYYFVRPAELVRKFGRSSLRFVLRSLTRRR